MFFLGLVIGGCASSALTRHFSARQFSVQFEVSQKEIAELKQMIGDQTEALRKAEATKDAA